MNKPKHYKELPAPSLFFREYYRRLVRENNWIYCPYCEEMTPNLADCPFCEDIRGIQAEPDYEPYVLSQ